MRGLLFPFVEIPLIRILEAAPGAPDEAVMLTPATCPWSACYIRVGFKFSIVSLPTTDTAPVTSFFRWVP